MLHFFFVFVTYLLINFLFDVDVLNRPLLKLAHLYYKLNYCTELKMESLIFVFTFIILQPGISNKYAIIQSKITKFPP